MRGLPPRLRDLQAKAVQAYDRESARGAVVPWLVFDVEKDSAPGRPWMGLVVLELRPGESLLPPGLIDSD